MDFDETSMKSVHTHLYSSVATTSDRCDCCSDFAVKATRSSSAGNNDYNDATHKTSVQPKCTRRIIHNDTNHRICVPSTISHNPEAFGKNPHFSINILPKPINTKLKPADGKSCVLFSSYKGRLSLIHVLLAVIVFVCMNSVTSAQNTARCYYFGPGMTIPGSEYRRDYGIERKVCAETCKLDSCCMAFEWREKDGICTLKSRSVNGSVTPAEDDTYFGLCLDYEDAERDRLWDHEIIGPSVASVARISREKCSVMCAEAAPAAIRKRTMDPLHIGQSAMKGKPVFYSWKTENERDVDSELGTCQCVTVLKEVKLSFGSFSGFLL
ncbi:PAN domain protein [Ditylenchus destructor]|uniref:PAN domain protein n=1 Tax=Ditylenchus destructor TaxID=166010 RepID=A0AAD4NE05_9BILA|nr:PAN domain protein [Ditylenchus destructor]